MNGQSSMFGEVTSEDTNSATSSPALGAGRTRSSSRDGKGKSGPGVVPASPSPWQEAEKARLTSGTFGPLFDGLSKSAALQSSLESRLRARLDVHGSPEYVLTWKSWDMPVGPPICALRASQRRTSGKGFTGWPSPRVSDTNGPGEHGEGGQDLRTTVQTAGWGTPTSQDAKHSSFSPSEQKRTAGLRKQVGELALTGWPTPNAMEGGQTSRGGDRKGEPLMGGLVKGLAGWPTTTTMDHIEREGLRPSRIATNRTGGYIAEVLAGWTTPSARDWKDSDGMSTTGTNPDGSERNRIDQLPRQVFAAVSGWATPTVADAGKITEASHQEGVRQQIYGRPSKSSPAETGSRGALHPAFPCWLMGFPSEWVSCVVSGTP